MATPNYGTLGLIDTLRTIDNANIFEYGEDRLYAHVRDLLVAHNAMTQDMLTNLVERTSDKIRRFGAGTVGGEMIEVDEYGVVDVQKTSVTGHDVGFPLRAYQYAIGWTRRYFEVKTVADIAKEFVAAQTADVRGIKRQLLRALFTPTNNLTYIDRLDNSVTLPIRALQNADSTAIPADQYGNTFDGSTHTHYLARAGGSLAASDITSLIDTLVEHGLSGGQQVILYINKAQEAAVEALSLFSPFQAPLIDPGPGSTANVVDGGRKLNPYTLDDRPIGVWDGYVMVWTKPWIPASYLLAFVTGGGDRVLAMRTRPVQGYGDFRIVFDNEHFPLRAQHFEREFGVSVWNRTGAAVLYSGGTSYVAPTIA